MISDSNEVRRQEKSLNIRIKAESGMGMQLSPWEQDCTSDHQVVGCCKKVPLAKPGYDQ